MEEDMQQPVQMRRNTLHEINSEERQVYRKKD